MRQIRFTKGVFIIEVIVIVVLLSLIWIAYSPASELPLYPQEDSDRLDYYDIGVVKDIVTKEVAFKYENITKDMKTVRTVGTMGIIPAPDAELISLKITYVITNKDRGIVKEVVLLETDERADIYRFDVEYDYSTDYNLGAIHISLLEAVDIEPSEEGEKLNV